MTVQSFEVVVPNQPILIRSHSNMSSNNIRVRNYGQSYPIYKSFAFFSSKDNVENNNDHDFVAFLTVKLPSLYIDATSQNQSNANNKSETHERIKYSCERLLTYFFSTSVSNVNKNEKCCVAKQHSQKCKHEDRSMW